MEIESCLKELRKLDLNQYKKIGIVTCISSSLKNNFDSELLANVLTELRGEFNGNITLFEKKYKDSDQKNIPDDIHILLKKSSIKHIYITLDNIAKREIPKGRIYKYLYLNEDFIDTDLKIILTKASIHKHHYFTYPFSCKEEIALLIGTSTIDWIRFKRTDVVQVLRAELIGIYNDLISEFPDLDFYGILDARSTKISNEHIPFFSKKKNLGVLYGRDLDKIEKDLTNIPK